MNERVQQLLRLPLFISANLAAKKLGINAMALLMPSLVQVSLGGRGKYESRVAVFAIYIASIAFNLTFMDTRYNIYD